MATLKEFEDALREQGMTIALGILARLRERDRRTRTVSPARRVVGRKMTPDLAREILRLHASSDMTQQEIAFQLGINQGRVNEVIKRGKWLSADPASPEAGDRDRALARMKTPPRAPRPPRVRTGAKPAVAVAPKTASAPRRKGEGQLTLGDL